MKRWGSFALAFFMLLSCNTVRSFATDESTQSDDKVVETDNSAEGLKDDGLSNVTEDNAIVDEATKDETSSESVVSVEVDGSDSDKILPDNAEISKIENSDDVQQSVDEVPSQDDSISSQESDEFTNESSTIEATEINPSVPSNAVFMIPENENTAVITYQDKSVVYVGITGKDDNDGVSIDAPYLTLSKAVEEVADNGTVIVISNLELSNTVRVWDKHITLRGEGDNITISRSDDFNTIQDTARSTYNGAMIEVGGNTNNSVISSLRLENISLDDNGTHEGNFQIQAQGAMGNTIITIDEKEYSVNNGNIVQDAIIASYNGKGSITLGNGAYLLNYGGMSAVRLTGSSKLVMESGSAIIDNKEVDRTRYSGEVDSVNVGDEKTTFASYGVAGAIWIQGGSFEMQQGSILGGQSNTTTMTGRAIFVDGGTVTVNGTIQNIVGSPNAWHCDSDGNSLNLSGIAIHLRNIDNSTATIGSTGLITNVSSPEGFGSARNTSVVWVQGNNFNMEAGSAISDCKNVYAINFDDNGNNYSHVMHIDGSITGFQNNYNNSNGNTPELIKTWYGTIEFGSTSSVSGNSTIGDGGVLYSNNGSRYVLRGKMNNNTSNAGVIYLANQGGARPTIDMYDGAEINNNSGLAVRVNNGSLFTMHGGTVSNNGGDGFQVTGKTSYRNVSLIVESGTITDNTGYGINFEYGGDALASVAEGVIISNNQAGEILLNNSRETNAFATNEYNNLTLSANVLGGNKSISVLQSLGNNSTVNLGTIYQVDNADGYKLGVAKDDAYNSIKNQLNNSDQYENWQLLGSEAFWFMPSSNNLTFKVSRPIDAINTTLYVVYIPLEENGAPLGNENITVIPVESEDVISVTIPNLTAGHAYAIAFANSAQYVLKPDDVTIYTGGGNGNDNYSTGFPRLTFTDSLDEIKSWSLDGVEKASSGVQALDEILELFTVSYSDAQTNESVPNDGKAGEYSVNLEYKDGEDHSIRINGNDVVLGDGSDLIVRYISDKEGATNGEITIPVSNSHPDTDVSITTAVVDSDAKFYINNDVNRLVEGQSQISILDDTLLQFEDDNRQLLLEKKAKEVLPEIGSGRFDYQFDWHYLDLVDAFNGNVWVASSSETIVYLPYPDGTDSSTKFYLLHFDGLHREYGIRGQADVEQAIEMSTVESVEIENNNGIKFTVGQSGFSPFAIVWKEPVHSITVEYKDIETQTILKSSETFEFAEGDSYDLTSYINIPIEGYQYVRSTGTVVGVMGETDLSITVFYKSIKTENDDVNVGSWDDGSPFTTDECGSVYDRWGNLIYQGVCDVTTGFQLVNTKDN